MLDFSNIKIEKIITHFVGNAFRNEELIFSDTENQPAEEVARNLLNILLPCFNESNEEYHFTHPTEIELNPVLKYVQQILNRKEFSKNSQRIAKILYENSTHPNIKSGEFIVVFFSGINFKGSPGTGLGFFKPESKQKFLRLDPNEKNYDYFFIDGITSKNIEKAALILNTNPEPVFLYNKFSSTDETKFWKDEFLGVTLSSNSFSNTKNFMNMCKEFITKRYVEDFEVNKTDQIDLLSRSISYFKDNEEVNIESFKKDIFHHASVIKSFDNFRDEYQASNDIDFADTIEISKVALKKQNRQFKNILKLDKNFDIYIHGNRDLIESGVEKDGRKFYKIYYNNES